MRTDNGIDFGRVIDHSNDEDRAWDEYRYSPGYRTPAQRAAKIEAEQVLQYIPSFRSEN